MYVAVDIMSSQLTIPLVPKKFSHYFYEWVATSADDVTGVTVLYQHSKQARSDDNPNEFHRYCDGKQDIFVVWRVGEYLFGGYTSTGFVKGDTMEGHYISDSSAFLFTLSNPHAIPPTQYHVENPDKAVFYHEVSGPIIGNVGCAHSPAKVWINMFDAFKDTTGKGDRTFTDEYVDQHLDDFVVFQLRKGRASCLCSCFT
eukprot:m.304476 g.304476  ORF g.304476 m.304476 type:complete len:200 (+) comp15900_c0_seq1:118-717(+)